jgi:hypothetical protein
VTVGYSGLVVIARSDVRLDELSCIDALFVAVTDVVRADGWRIGFLGPADETSPAHLAWELVAQTGAPAVVLSVFDSDVADAAAIGPSGHLVRFYLNEKAVLDLVDDPANVSPRNDAAVAGLLAWAVEAGAVADRDRIVAALARSPGVSGDGIIELATALGIPASRA